MTQSTKSCEYNWHIARNHYCTAVRSSKRSSENLGVIQSLSVRARHTFLWVICYSFFVFFVLLLSQLPGQSRRYWEIIYLVDQSPPVPAVRPIHEMKYPKKHLPATNERGPHSYPQAASSLCSQSYKTASNSSVHSSVIYQHPSWSSSPPFIPTTTAPKITPPVSTPRAPSQQDETWAPLPNKMMISTTHMV